MIETNFEYIILKSLIHDGLYFNKCFDILNISYFRDQGNKELFKLLKNYHNEYKQRPQEIALSTMIKDIPNAELRKVIIESLKRLKMQELNSNTEFMCNETVKYIKDIIYYKSLEIGSEGLMEKNEEKIKKAQALVEQMNKIQLDSDLGLDFDSIEEQIEYFSKREYGIKTAHKSINKRLGSGFLPGTLNVILAAQGVGKSLLMCDFMSTMLQDGKNILMVSLEMSENEMMKRINANVFDIDINSFRDLSKTKGELDQLERPSTTKDAILGAYEKYKAQGSCGKLFIKEFPAGSFSANMLASLVQKFENEKDIKFDIIFIDYLGIMKSDLLNPNAGLYAYVKSIGEEVRAQAVKLQVPIVSASQLNRCFSLYTNIITESGVKLAKDLKIGDKVLTTNNNYNTVQNITKPELKRAFKIKTKLGREIIVSEDHRIPTDKGLMTIRHGLTIGSKVKTNEK